ncbi:hypothetical protein Pmani_021159 [Petrolisthes manimaculis]|uniref:BZIP domain-containing protein n=1 Tax=Petrolisthes manimaculis TaxID=1843537 RepID=A0AAE1U1X9_9EUCA|nr:hypothetical protein Pmani_021159 [Petrolisthes manimaculis]
MAKKHPTTAANLPPGELSEYDQYLRNILTEYGLRFENDDSQITEMEEAPLSYEELKEAEEEEEEEEEEKEEEDLKVQAATVPGTSIYKRDANIDEEDRGEGGTSGSSDPPKKRIRKYEMQPLENPFMERKRVMAVTAKRYRDRQKSQMKELENMVEKKGRIISQCTKVIRRTNQDRIKLQKELTTSKEQQVEVEAKVKKKEGDVRDMREKLALFCGHLDIIAGSLDDDNPAKRLILSLLKRLPHRMSHQTTTIINPSPSSLHVDPVVEPDVPPTT